MRNRFLSTRSLIALWLCVSNICFAQGTWTDFDRQIAQAELDPRTIYLVGAWRNMDGNEQSRYLFMADGSYRYDALFAGLGINIQEDGNFRVDDSGVTLYPQRNIGGTARVRTFSWRVQTYAGSKRVLRLQALGVGITHAFAEE